MCSDKCWFCKMTYINHCSHSYIPCHWNWYDCTWTSDFQKTKRDEAWLSDRLSLSSGGSGVMKIWRDWALVQLNPTLVLSFIAHPGMAHHLAHSTGGSVSPTQAIMDLKRFEGCPQYLPMHQQIWDISAVPGCNENPMIYTKTIYIESCSSDMICEFVNFFTYLALNLKGNIDGTD